MQASLSFRSIAAFFFCFFIFFPTEEEKKEVFVSFTKENPSLGDGGQGRGRNPFSSFLKLEEAILEGSDLNIAWLVVCAGIVVVNSVTDR